ncbi:hypothetical protein ABH931_001066 [Streptacidiphilus sp. MAP12-33]
MATVRAEGVPFGVNLFAPNPVPVDPAAFRRDAGSLEPRARAHPGSPRLARVTPRGRAPRQDLRRDPREVTRRIRPSRSGPDPPGPRAAREAGDHPGATGSSRLPGQRYEGQSNPSVSAAARLPPVTRAQPVGGPAASRATAASTTSRGEASLGTGRAQRN